MNGLFILIFVIIIFMVVWRKHRKKQKPEDKKKTSREILEEGAIHEELVDVPLTEELQKEVDELTYLGFSGRATIIKLDTRKKVEKLQKYKGIPVIRKLPRGSEDIRTFDGYVSIKDVSARVVIDEQNIPYTDEMDSFYSNFIRKGTVFFSITHHTQRVPDHIYQIGNDIFYLSPVVTEDAEGWIIAAEWKDLDKK